MNPSWHVSDVQAGAGGIMMWEVFHWYTLGPLTPTEHHLNTVGYPSLVVDHAHLLVTSSNHDDTCHKAQTNSCVKSPY